MTDYYAALKEAIESLDQGSVEARRNLYDGARSILVRQLKAMDPPLAAQEISRQRRQLEEAIRRVERENAARVEDARGRMEYRSETSHGRAAARLAPEPEDDWPRSFAARAPVSDIDRPIRSRRPRRWPDDPDEDHAGLSERPARRSPFPAILVFAVIICLIGGLGALAWSQRTVIAGLLSGFGFGPQEVAAPQPVPALPETGVAPAPPVTSPPSASGVPSADEIAPEPPAADDPAAGRARAVLYEQPVDATAEVAAVGAAVDWRFVEDGAGGAEINAEIEVPERGMTIRLVIRLNSDADLPASHLVEVGIDTPADFAGKGIRDVPGLILKVDENQRGEPLIAAAIKVADGLFWIALSADEADVARNQQLLREGSWIDLRLLYETGRGAILSFEKGPRGREVFENAFAAWDTG